MRRILLLVAGITGAWDALRVGQKVPVTLPQNPEMLSELWQQTYWGRSWAMYGVATAATLATIIAGFTLFFGKLARQGVYTGPTGVSWTMVVLVLSAFAFGAFAQPFDFDPTPVQWWNNFDSERLAVGIAALMPTAFLLLSLASEVVARLAGRYTGNALPEVRVTTNLGELPGQINALYADLQERKKAPIIKWSDRLDAVDKGIADIGKSLAEHRGADLTALKTTLEEILSAVRQRNAQASPNPESDAADHLARVLEFLGEHNDLDPDLVEKVHDLLRAVERKSVPFLPPAAVAEAVRQAAE